MAAATGQIGNEIRQLIVRGEEVLGVRVAARRPGSTRQTGNTGNRHGWWVTSDTLETWEMTGIIDEGGEVYAYGPCREAQPLSELMAADPEKAIDSVASVVNSVLNLQKQGVSLSYLVPGTVLVDPDGAVLMLPQEMTDAMKDAHSGPDRLERFDRFCHPDLSGDRGVAFSIGVILYRVLTGEYPLNATTSEELHERMRRQRVVPPRLLRPELSQQVSDALVQALSFRESCGVSDFQRLLDGDGAGRIVGAVSDEERTRVAGEARRVTRKSHAQFNRAVFVRRNWKLLGVLGVAIIVGGVFGVSALSKGLSPGVTAGMGPEEVVRLFYTSITGMDSQTM